MKIVIDDILLILSCFRLSLGWKLGDLFENCTTTEMVNIFLDKIEHLVSLIFEKKKAFTDEDSESKSK